MSNEYMARGGYIQWFVSGVVPFLLIGCSPAQVGPSVAHAQAETGDKPAVSVPVASSLTGPESGSDAGQAAMDGQLMFELMIAELAGRRGQLDVAMAGYLRAATHTDDPRVSERATRLAVYGRQWEAVEGASRRWLQLAPEAESAHEILAQSLLRQSKPEEAVAIYQRLIEDAEDPNEVIRQIQAELQSINDTDLASQVMQSILESVPDNAQAYLTLARIQLANDETQGAQTSLDEALRLDPDSIQGVLLKAQLLIEAGQVDEAFDNVEAVLSRNPDSLVLRLGYAQLLVGVDHLEQVGEQLDTLYAGSGDNADTLLTISMLALDARLLDRASDYLTRLREVGNYPDQANYYLGRISDQRKDYDAAMISYNAVGESELQLPAQIRVAELLALSGNLEQGRERLNQLSQQVTDPAIHNQFVTAESRMLQQAGQAEEAVKVLTDGLKQSPNNGDLLYARALAADSAGDKAMLVADLSKLIESEPDNAHALNALGYHYADSNIELDRAEELLVRADELLPNDPAILDSLGWLRYRQGELSRSIDLLRSAYKLYPDAEIAAHLGEALWLNGDEQEARQLMEAALAKDPEDERLLRVKKQYIE